ncbi:transmembrane protein 187-like [Amphiprion ocellaris]|uniref:Transmembrane protein 187 n=1 Tax=Amphiprion ocellaris TaxID=80972 RepID=A0A3Q1C2M5_AMPOC|nr:transmembrane protein 187-like [Amphiprion ocellaris]
MFAALLSVSLPFLLCVVLVNTGLFDSVLVDLDPSHYAEKRVHALPAFLAMPCNCLVNVGYICVGLYWLLWNRLGTEPDRSRYMRQVFALMALVYAPVQWTRLTVLRLAPAVLDQWLTLPIFAWVRVWIRYIEEPPGRWSGAHGAAHGAALELCSLLSYGLTLLHARGFEAALGAHVALAVHAAVRLQLKYGDRRTRTVLLLAVLSFAGFVVLKLLDHQLARYRLFQRLTGHFWSKVCDVLQFHLSFRFLTALDQRVQQNRAKAAGLTEPVQGCWTNRTGLKLQD